MAKKKLTVTLDESIKQALQLFKEHTPVYYGDTSISYIIEFVTKLIIHRHMNDEQLFIEFDDELKSELEKLGFKKDMFKTIDGNEFKDYLDKRELIENNDKKIEMQKATLYEIGNKINENNALLERLEREVSDKNEQIRPSNKPSNNQSATAKRKTQKQLEAERLEEQRDIAQSLDVIRLCSSSGKVFMELTIKDLIEIDEIDRVVVDFEEMEDLDAMQQVTENEGFKLTLEGEKLQKEMIRNAKEEDDICVTNVTVIDEREVRRKEQEMAERREKRERQELELERKKAKVMEKREGGNKGQSKTREIPNVDEVDENETINNDENYHTFGIKFYSKNDELTIDVIEDLALLSGRIEIDGNYKINENAKILANEIGRKITDNKHNQRAIVKFLENQFKQENQEVLKEVLESTFEYERDDERGVLFVDMGEREIVFKIVGIEEEND